MLFENKKNGDCHYGIWKIEENEEILSSLLPNSFNFTPLQHFRSQKRRLEWLAVRVLFSSMGYDPMKISYKKSGKPFLLDSSFFFSCSHTKEYVSVIIHANQEVGIDIEERGIRVKRVVSKFLKPKEISQFENGDSLLYYHLCWSAKEAVFKIIDQPEFDFVNNLTINPFQISSEDSFFVEEKITSKHLLFQVHYEIKEDFVLCWAHEKLI